jgi:hypothetical protein
MFPHDHFMYRYKARTDLINPEQALIVESSGATHSRMIPFLMGFFAGVLSTILFD